MSKSVSLLRISKANTRKKPLDAASRGREGGYGFTLATPTLQVSPLAKPNYSFEKRQRELAKKKKQEEKDAAKRAAREAASPPPASNPSPGAGTDVPGGSESSSAS